ncbi:MAG: DNA replication/repair protein RecF [Bdellovibrionales bacterium]|nr:DNA replication/repair protein RecF [Bdellovibrionales bacterium]
MHLSSLSPYCFRNLSPGSITFSPGLNFIFGKNGQGKSNILEAVSLLSTTTSFRTKRSSDLTTWGKDECSVAGIVSQDGTIFELLVTLQHGRRSAFVNGDRLKRLSDFVGKLPAVTFSPNDLELIKGGPGERRAFLDRYCSFLYPQYFESLSRLHQITRSKAALLKENPSSLSALQSWNELFAEEAFTVASFRRLFISDLEPGAQIVHRRYASNDGSLELRLVSQLLHESGAVKSRQEILNDLSAVHQRERAAAKVLYGPQRDDIEIFLNEKSSRSFASQGQSRSLVLSLLMSVLELLRAKNGDYPILLLDDVESELDHGRRNDFFTALLDHGCQTIVTGTERAEFSISNQLLDQASYYVVEAGEVCQIDSKN